MNQDIETASDVVRDHVAGLGRLDLVASDPVGGECLGDTWRETSFDDEWLDGVAARDVDGSLSGVVSALGLLEPEDRRHAVALAAEGMTVGMAP